MLKLLSRRCLPVLLASALLAPFASAQAAPAEAGVTAEQVLSAAESQAAAQHKAVLLSFSASWCGNCKLFDRFLADPAMHPLMAAAFVFADLTTGENPGDKRHTNTPGGQKVQAELGGKTAGWPYLVMLDAHGKLLASSVGPDGNIGYPDSRSEIAWFVEMLRKSSPALTAADLGKVQAWLIAHSTQH